MADYKKHEKLRSKLFVFFILKFLLSIQRCRFLLDLSEDATNFSIRGKYDAINIKKHLTAAAFLYFDGMRIPVKIPSASAQVLIAAIFFQSELRSCRFAVSYKFFIKPLKHKFTNNLHMHI